MLRKNCYIYGVKILCTDYEAMTSLIQCGYPLSIILTLANMIRQSDNLFQSKSSSIIVVPVEARTFDLMLLSLTVQLYIPV